MQIYDIFMKYQKIKKLRRVSWRETIEKIGKSETAIFTGTAEDANKIRVAASVLNKKLGTHYSIGIVGNTITVKNV